MSKKGVKSVRGKPEMYSEAKMITSLSLTPTAIKKLDDLAKSKQLSRSEFVEQIARGLIELSHEETVLPLSSQIDFS